MADEDKKRAEAEPEGERGQVAQLEQEAQQGAVERIRPAPQPKGVNLPREPFPWEADPTALVPKA